MSTIFQKHSTTISLLLLFAMLITAYVYPTNVLLFGMILLVSFVILSFMVFGKHREAYLHDKFPRAILVRNTSVEILSVLLTLILAGYLGWYIVNFVTDYMNQSFAKLIMAITVSLIAGAMAGILIHRITKHLIKTS